MPAAAILVDQRGPFKKEALQPLFLQTLKKIRTITEEVYLLTLDTDFFPNINIKPVNYKTSAEFLSFLAKDLSGKSVLILNAFAAILDVESLKIMLKEHQEQSFDFTYPENIPQGLLPEIIEADVADFIRQTIPQNVGLFTKSVRELFEKDLSSYDCNIFISPSRILKYRVNLIPDNRNNFLTIQSLMLKGYSNLSIMELEKKIAEEPGLIRHRPTYYEIELTTEREAGSIFASSLLKRDGSMKLSDLDAILNQIQEFSNNPMVSLGLYGDSCLYPHFFELPSLLSKYPDMQFLIECRGLLLHSEILNELLKLSNIKFIFDLSAAKQDTWEKLKLPQNTMLPKISLEAIENKIKNLHHPENIFLQFTRTTENEEDILPFYEKWKGFSSRIIVKKPDLFGGVLEKIRVVDLSPVERFACLHLKHDMVIFYDGTVPLCRQDLNGENPAGNILSDGVEKCWESFIPTFNAHWNKEFDHPPLCKNCDEWWVFNQ